MFFPYEFDYNTVIKNGRASNKNVKEIQEWLKTARIPNLQPEFIVLFLIACDNDVSATKTTIKSFFKIKSQTPDIFKNKDIDNEALTKIRQVVIGCSFPKRLGNSVIQFYKLNDTDYRKFILSDIFKLGFMMIDVNQRYDPPDDLIIIIDLEGLNAMHLTRLRINIMKAFVDFLQGGMPFKIKNIHVLNANYVAEKFIAAAKLFMKKPLADALEVHPISMKMEDFYEKYIPASHLPKEYGGELPSYMKLQEATIEQLWELKPFFEAEDKLIKDYETIN